MNRLERAIAEHRAAIRSIDRSALGNVLNTYEEIMARLNPQIEVLVQTLRTKGELTPSELFRLDRYQELQRQIAEEMRTLATATGDITAQAQARAIQEAVTSAENMAVSAARGTSATATVATSWVNVPTKAVEDFIGASRSGPLAELLASFEDVTGRELVNQITNALATGTNPRAVADAIVKSTEIGRNRALVISRTEMMRASRSASIAQYENNSDILSGWQWSCALSDRTCAACLSMSGTIHPLTEAMESHPACRCSPVPVLRDIPMRKIETGEEWLAKQPPEAQDAILGKAGGIAYRNGEVQLSHFVRVTDSADWGRSVTDGGIGWARFQAGQERRAA